MSRLNEIPGLILQADLDDMRRRGDKACKRMEARARANKRRKAFRAFVKKAWNIICLT